MVKGSQPTDDGNLLLDSDGYIAATSDPVARKYVRRFVGARELIHDTGRWCLWMEELDPNDLARSRFLRERVEACRAFRAGSKKLSTQASAATAHLFTERRQPAVPYICIPRHFSETRRFATVAYFSPEVIAGDANFTAEDATGYLFALIGSSMFLAWQKAVGGRIKSDLRFSATIVWNTFPLPELSDSARDAIIAAGQGVLDARALRPERALAQHYNKLAMDPRLIKAHDALDRVVDKAFGARKALQTEEERQEVLFKRYADLADS